MNTKKKAINLMLVTVLCSVILTILSFPNLVYAENPAVGEDEYIDELRSFGVSEEEIGQLDDTASVKLNTLTINECAVVHFKMYFEPDNRIFNISDTNITFSNFESGIDFYWQLRHYDYDRENHIAECTIVIPATELYHEYWVDVFTYSNGFNSTNVAYQYKLNAEAGKEYDLTTIAGTSEWIEENAKTLLADYIDAGEYIKEVGTFNKNAVGYNDESNDTPQILGEYELDEYGKVKIYDLQGRSCGSLDIDYMIDGFTPFESYLALNLYGWDTTVETLPKGFKKLDLYIDNPVYPESELTDEKRAEYEEEGIFDRSPYVDGWAEESTEIVNSTEEIGTEEETESITTSVKDNKIDIKKYLPYIVGVVLVIILLNAIRKMFK